MRAGPLLFVLVTSAIVGCAGERGGTRGEAPTPARDGWDADWLWAGPHADADAAYGFGSVRLERSPMGVADALGVARTSAASLVLSPFAPASDGPKRFSAEETARLGEELAKMTTVVGTWTSTTGRAFAATRLAFSDALQVLAKAPGWRPDDERIARAGFVALQKERPASPRVAPAWTTVTASISRGSPAVLSGMGVASNIKNLALARSAADARARGEVSKSWEMIIALLFRDYSQRWGTGEIRDNPAPEGDEVPRADAVAWMRRSLSDVHIAQRWYDVRNDVHYSRAELDLARFFEALARDGLVPEQAKRVETSLRAVLEAWQAP